MLTWPAMVRDSIGILVSGVFLMFVVFMFKECVQEDLVRITFVCADSCGVLGVERVTIEECTCGGGLLYAHEEE